METQTKQQTNTDGLQEDFGQCSKMEYTGCSQSTLKLLHTKIINLDGRIQFGKRKHFAKAEFVLREPDKDVNWDRSSTAISRKVTQINRTNMAVWIISSSRKCFNYITLLLVKYEALPHCHQQCCSSVGTKRGFQQILGQMPEVFPIFVAQSQMAWALRRCYIR